MALVGSTNLGTTHRLELHLSQNSPNVANNTSTVGYTLQIVRVTTNAGGYWNNNQSSATLTINGTAITVPSFTYDFRTNYTKVLSTGSITVAHNADGTKTVASSASVTMNAAGLIPSGSVSGSLALSTIPRASSFTIPSSYTMGNAFTATITRASSAFTHNITVKYGNLTVLSGTGYGTSASLNINHTALYNATPTVSSAVLVVTMSTLSGGTVIGSSSKNITATNATRPTFSTLTHSDSNTAISTRFGAYIQSKSRVSLAITGAAASTGATIKSYRITVDGQVLNAASGTTLVLKGSGSLTATGTVTDSRGFSISKSVTLSVLAYTPPAITSVSIQRVNSAGINDDYGKYGKFVLGYRVTPLDNKNSVSTKVKIGTADTWAPQTAFTGTYTVQYGTFDVNLSYNAEFIAADYFGSTVSPQVLPTGAVTMMWGRDWISVGTAEGKGSGTLNVHGQIYQNGGMEVADITGMRALDLRATNHPPSWYFQNRAGKTLVEFKQSNIFGLGSFGMYMKLITISAYRDATGGDITQIAIVNGALMFKRSGSGETWAAWSRIGGVDEIVERDPDGNWEKWESGKFVQRGYHNSVVPINIAIGSGFRAAEAINFGFPFLAGTHPHVVASSANYANVSVQSTTATAVRLGYTSFDINRQPGGIRYVATGRWK